MAATIKDAGSLLGDGDSASIKVCKFLELLFSKKSFFCYSIDVSFFFSYRNRNRIIVGTTQIARKVVNACGMFLGSRILSEYVIVLTRFECIIKLGKYVYFYV